MAFIHTNMYLQMNIKNQGVPYLQVVYFIVHMLYLNNKIFKKIIIKFNRL